MTLPTPAVLPGRPGARTRRRFWTRIWWTVAGSTLAYLPVALAPHLLHAVVRGAEEVTNDRTATPVRSGVLTTLTVGDAAAVLGVLAALVIALNLIAWSLGNPTATDSPNPTRALRLEHVELCGSVLGVGASMAFAASLADGLPESVDLAGLLLFPAAFVIVVLSQDLFLATERGAGIDARRMLQREESLLRRRELLAAAAFLRPRDPRVRRHPGPAFGVELAALTIVTAAAGVLLNFLLDDPAEAAGFDVEDAVEAVVFSASLVLMSVVLVPWTVRCLLLRRYVGAVLSMVTVGTLYVILGAGIVWAAVDEEIEGDTVAATVVLLVWTLIPPLVLLVGTRGIDGRYRLPGVNGVLWAALLRERHRLRHAEAVAPGFAVPSLKYVVTRARAVARATDR